MTAAVRIIHPEPVTSATPATRPAVAVQPSARTLAHTVAADTLRDTIDALCIEHRLTAAEVATILACEMMRRAQSDLMYERQTGNTAPLCLRYLKPSGEDRNVDEAVAVCDGLASAAIGG